MIKTKTYSTYLTMITSSVPSVARADAPQHSIQYPRGGHTTEGYSRLNVSRRFQILPGNISTITHLLVCYKGILAHPCKSGEIYSYVL